MARDHRVTRRQARSRYALATHRVNGSVMTGKEGNYRSTIVAAAPHKARPLPGVFDKSLQRHAIRVRESA
jgi:hypothetical protein